MSPAQATSREKLGPDQRRGDTRPVLGGGGERTCPEKSNETMFCAQRNKIQRGGEPNNNPRRRGRPGACEKEENPVEEFVLKRARDREKQTP